jgi:glycyl-tRNA synthetase
MNPHATLEKVTSLCKRRGFVYPSSEIYGGLANTWDYGPYGTQLKNNVRDLWWKTFVTSRDDIVGLDASVILNPVIWEASGHTKGFADAMVDCKQCKNRTRADHLIEDRLGIKVEGKSMEEINKIIQENKIPCPNCGSRDLTDARPFNQLFETHIGIVPENKSLAYLRGEIAQGIFINFKNIIDSMRVRIPFGIAQQGKAFRNEITKGKFIHRTLEFDLMEFEYFFHPTEQQWEDLFSYWQKEMWSFALRLGIREENLRWREHEEFERAFYSKKTMDIEYEYPFGFKEMFGLAYRTDYDLTNHVKNSGKDLSYTDPKTNEKYIPHVIEPTFGLSRLIGVMLFDAYTEEKVNEGIRTVLKLDPKIAPVKAAIFPLQKDEKLQRLSEKLYKDLKAKIPFIEYDNAGNIGKMYRRQDEIGTPYCITVDYQSLEDKTVTIRDRDTMQQERIPINKLEALIEKKISEK